MSRLQAAIEAGRAAGKLALYFGCWSSPGHYLHGPGGRDLYGDERMALKLPWTDDHMDCGLLKNGRRADAPDGRVFWTCGGAPALWYAFFWWDRSGDRRGASNSGFYVRGFGWPEAQEAFDYACATYPNIVARQKHPLVLQESAPSSETPTSPSERSDESAAALDEPQ